MNRKIWKRGIWGLFSVYVFFLLGNLLVFRLIRLLLFGFNYYYYNSETLVGNANIIPFKTIWLFVIHYHDNYFHFYTVFYNVLLNIAAFVPLGIFLPMIFFRLEKFWIFLVLTTISFLIIEFLQLFLHLGQFDIDDVLLNSIGAILGYYLLQFVVKKKWIDQVWK